MPSNEEIYFIEPSTIENVDASIFEWLDDKLSIHVETNKGWEKVPVVWTSSERSHQVKNRKKLRDDKESLILPMISVERTGMTKDLGKRGIFWGNQPHQGGYDPRGGCITFSRRIQQEKSSFFNNADMERSALNGGRGQLNFPREKNKVVYETFSMPMPVYLDMTYQINLRSEYQQQMNEMVIPFVNTGLGINHFMLERNGHKYEGFIQSDFSQDNNVSSMTGEERKFETKVEIKVLGYTMGSGKNDERPKVSRRETQAEFRMMRERTIVADSIDDIGTDMEAGIDGKYRE